MASIIVSFLAASSAPTPLCAFYASHWGFSPLATTVVFGVYALAVLADLLIFGKLSDHIGRRPVLLAGLVLQAAAMVQFAVAGGLGTLQGARIVQGAATGSVLAAAGAAAVRGEVAIAAPVLSAVWALAGFDGSLGPALAAMLLHSSSVVYGGLSLFILAGVASGSVLVLNRASARSMLYLGITALIAGIAVTLVATSTGSAMGFFTGTAISGVGFGSGFQGSIRLVVPLVGEQDRAGVLPAPYVVVYLGLGAPAVIGGVLATDVNGLLATAREYGLAVVVLAVLALAGLLAHRNPQRVAQ